MLGVIFLIFTLHYGFAPILIQLTESTKIWVYPAYSLPVLVLLWLWLYPLLRCTNVGVGPTIMSYRED